MISRPPSSLEESVNLKSSSQTSTQLASALQWPVADFLNWECNVMQCSAMKCLKVFLSVGKYATEELIVQDYDKFIICYMCKNVHSVFFFSSFFFTIWNMHNVFSINCPKMFFVVNSWRRRKSLKRKKLYKKVSKFDLFQSTSKEEWGPQDSAIYAYKTFWAFKSGKKSFDTHDYWWNSCWLCDSTPGQGQKG